MTRNLLLRRLLNVDRDRIAPHLSALTLAGGSIIHAAGERTELFWFPDDCLATLRANAQDRWQVEIAAVGYEGVFGWSALLGCNSTLYQGIVEGRGGSVMVIPREVLLAASRANGVVQQLLLTFIHSVTVQMASTISSTVAHSLIQRIARWLLLRYDRIVGDHIFVRHDTIAECLGARRASVTDCLHILEGERLIRARRGQIVIRDRGGLERFAGGAYILDEAARAKALSGSPPVREPARYVSMPRAPQVIGI